MISFLIIRYLDLQILFKCLLKYRLAIFGSFTSAVELIRAVVNFLLEFECTNTPNQIMPVLMLQ